MIGVVDGVKVVGVEGMVVLVVLGVGGGVPETDDVVTVVTADKLYFKSQRYRWLTAQMKYVQKTCFRENRKITEMSAKYNSEPVVVGGVGVGGVVVDGVIVVGVAVVVIGVGVGGVVVVGVRVVGVGGVVVGGV